MAGTKELIKAVSEKHGMSQKVIAEVTESIFSSIPEIVIHAPIQIRGFGSFKIVERAERKGRNPKTGEIVTVPAKSVLRFKASKKQ